MASPCNRIVAGSLCTIGAEVLPLPTCVRCIGDLTLCNGPGMISGDHEPCQSSPHAAMEVCRHTQVYVTLKHVCAIFNSYHPLLPVVGTPTDQLQIAHVQGRRQLSKNDIAQTFHLPIERAARSLGVGLTVLKRQCREFGISRWPFRKMKSLERMLSIVEVSRLAVYCLQLRQVLGLTFFSPTGYEHLQHESFADQRTTAAGRICAVRGRATAESCSAMSRQVCRHGPVLEDCYPIT